MYLVSLLHGHGTSAWPALQRHADGVHARHELAVAAELLEGGGAHAGHDPHRGDDVRRIGELDADVGLVGAQRAHDERHDVHRAAAHAAGEQLAERLAHLGGVTPVVGRARVALLLGADEGLLLHARDVAGIGEREVAAGALLLVELAERAGLDELRGEAVELGLRAVGPDDLVRRGELGDLVDPGEQPGVGGGS